MYPCIYIHANMYVYTACVSMYVMCAHFHMHKYRVTNAHSRRTHAAVALRGREEAAVLALLAAVTLQHDGTHVCLPHVHCTCSDNLMHSGPCKVSGCRGRLENCANACVKAELRGGNQVKLTVMTCRLRLLHFVSVPVESGRLVNTQDSSSDYHIVSCA
jgi:hypothetical protein